MSEENTQVRLTGLARRFVNEGVLSQEAAQNAQVKASIKRLPFITYLLQNELADSKKVLEVVSKEFALKVTDLSEYGPETIPEGVVKDGLIKKYDLIPLFKRNNRLTIAMADPVNNKAIEDVKFNTGLQVDVALVDYRDLKALIAKFMESTETTMGDLSDDALEDLEVDEDGDDPGALDTSDVDDAPIVKFVNKILLDAIRGGASDIHFEPYEKIYRVRYRVDGMLKEIAKPSIKLAPKIGARVKIMSKLDISERRVPQDGRIKMKLSATKAIDFRVNTLPTLWGEKIVLRILDGEQAKMDISDLGFDQDQMEMYHEALSKPQGMILVTGPTGSGKTVSLYSGLNRINTPNLNISTAEDPAEINLVGVNQVNVNPKVGLTFAEALRSFLRQDPDVIMVGEIRDLETAEIAIKAAQTGHLVLSTLHTNSAAETLTRLLNMGVPSFNVASSVSLIIAQRLCRRLCPHCKEKMNVPADGLKSIGFSDEDIAKGVDVYKAVGCDKCTDGYKGRVGVYEVVKVTDDIARLIMEGANSLQIAKKAQEEGFRNLRQSALRKIAEGMTTVEEANRVTTD